MINKSKTSIGLDGMDKKKRPIGVTVLGYWLILQGWISIDYSSQIGIWAWVFAALFVIVGVGILKSQKEAYIASLVIVISIFVWALFILLFYGITEATGITFAGIIISVVIIFYLSRKHVRGFFTMSIKGLRER